VNDSLDFRHCQEVGGEREFNPFVSRKRLGEVSIAIDEKDPSFFPSSSYGFGNPVKKPIRVGDFPLLLCKNLEADIAREYVPRMKV